MASARSSFFRPSLRVVATLYFWWASKRKQGNLGKKFQANLEVCGQSFTKDICSYGSHEFISKRLHQNYISNQRNTFVVSTSKIGGLAHQKCTQSSSRRIGRKNEERAEAKSKSLYCDLQGTGPVTPPPEADPGGNLVMYLRTWTDSLLDVRAL